WKVYITDGQYIIEPNYIEIKVRWNFLRIFSQKEKNNLVIDKEIGKVYLRKKPNTTPLHPLHLPSTNPKQYLENKEQYRWKLKRKAPQKVRLLKYCRETFPGILLSIKCFRPTND